VGGVAAPLLANIALHGLETAIRDAFPVTAMVNGRRVCPWQPIVIRYADDFLVLHEDRTVIERCQRITMAWLANMGLELKPSKTRITHTLRDTGGNVGFDFLGFAVRQHPVGKTHSGKNTVGEPLGYKTIITPSNEAVHRHARAMSSVIRAHKGVSQAALSTPSSGAGRMGLLIATSCTVTATTAKRRATVRPPSEVLVTIEPGS